MGSKSHRELIDQIRREKFGIGTKQSASLTVSSLREEIAHLSTELFQDDINFLSELIQNAETNVYGSGVTPSLELLLTYEDIAQVGAIATLILFNNEVGFQPRNVEALCAVGLSTKNKKHDSGYNGANGMGFKSVFQVTETPYVISNGYRFRFTVDANNEAKIGYVVPEWVDVPADEDLRRAYGRREEELPKTIVILPLRREKIDPVRELLEQITPETILFSSKLRELAVRGLLSSSELLEQARCRVGSRDSLYTTERDRDVSLAMTDKNCKMAVVTVRSKVPISSNAWSNKSEKSYTCYWLQQQFPVTHRVKQRKDVETWTVTIAFPLDEHTAVPDRFNGGDIYAFFSSGLASGFRFAVNANFLLSSQNTLKFDSPWNIGILSCIPIVFMTAFNIFLKYPHAVSIWNNSDIIRDFYWFIPVEQPENNELRKVRQRILDLLRQEYCIVVDRFLSYIPTPSALSVGSTHVFCKPESGRLIRDDFRTILIAAFLDCQPNPAVRNLRWHVVDQRVQDSYTPTLEALGVPHMSDDEYIECLNEKDWLLNLNCGLYSEVVRIVWSECSSSTPWSKCSSSTLSQMRTVPVFKYRKEDGSMGLKSFQEYTADGAWFYEAPSERGSEGILSKWTCECPEWVGLLFVLVLLYNYVMFIAGTSTPPSLT